MSKPESKSVLTTGEVAAICNVAARTVSKWIDSGRLAGYRIPGSRDRRVTREALDAFVRDTGIPTSTPTTEGVERVLVVDADRETAKALASALAAETDREVRVSTTAFAAGVECAGFAPRWIIADTSLGLGEVTGLAAWIRSTGTGARLAVMGSAFTPQEEAMLRQAGASAIFRKPFTLRQVVEVLSRRLAAAG
jgi:excisionase family DNA binding protein